MTLLEAVGHGDRAGRQDDHAVGLFDDRRAGDPRVGRQPGHVVDVDLVVLSVEVRPRAAP